MSAYFKTTYGATDKSLHRFRHLNVPDVDVTRSQHDFNPVARDKSEVRGH